MIISISTTRLNYINVLPSHRIQDLNLTFTFIGSPLSIEYRKCRGYTTESVEGTLQRVQSVHYSEYRGYTSESTYIEYGGYTTESMEITLQRVQRVHYIRVQMVHYREYRGYRGFTTESTEGTLQRV